MKELFQLEAVELQKLQELLDNSAEVNPKILDELEHIDCESNCSGSCGDLCTGPTSHCNGQCA